MAGYKNMKGISPKILKTLHWIENMFWAERKVFSPTPSGNNKWVMHLNKIGCRWYNWGSRKKFGTKFVDRLKTEKQHRVCPKTRKTRDIYVQKNCYLTLCVHARRSVDSHNFKLHPVLGRVWYCQGKSIFSCLTTATVTQYSVCSNTISPSFFSGEHEWVTNLFLVL